MTKGGFTFFSQMQLLVPSLSAIFAVSAVDNPG